MLPIVINFLLAINIIVSLLIILLVLMQRPKNEGLGAAFGGGMTENLFGAQTSNVLQTITRWLGGIFFSLTLLLSWLYVKKDFNRSSLQQRLSAPTVIPAKPAGGPTAQELEKMLQDAAKTPATPPAPDAAKSAPAPESAPVPAPDAAKPAPAPEAAKSTPSAPEAAKPAPAPDAAKPADAPAPAPDKAPEAPKP